MDAATPKPAERTSNCEIVYDSDEYNLYRIYKKYEQLSEEVDAKLAKIRNKKVK